MWSSILSALKDVGGTWTKLSMVKKGGLLSLGLLILTCMIGLGVWVGQKSYTPLYTNLTPEGSMNLVKLLQEENIPFIVSNDGATISIPPEFVQSTTMKLAVRGMPDGQKPGLELFDKESFGTSSYVQRINYVRALQGELTRTITTLRPVRKATVHISLPPKSSFLEQSEDPKASVVIEMHPGKTLAKTEVKGIQNLVASSVEGLRPERVTVVDSSGVALSKTGDVLSAITTTMMEKQQQVEHEMERRIEDIVGRIMGQGNIVARVNAELDFDPVQERETLFDPEQTALRSQSKQENNMEASRPVAGGGTPSGAAAAVPGPASTPPESKQNVAKTNDKSDFEVSNKIRNKEKALGAVKRLSVAVLVNEQEVKGADGKVTSQPISDEKRATIERLVKDAVGFTAGRDSVTVESSSFAKEDLEKADEFLSQQERRHLLYQLITYGTVGLLILIFFLVVVRPFVRWLTGLSSTQIETVLPKTVEELEKMQDTVTNSLPGMANLPLLEETVDLEKAENELLKEKVVSLIDMSPEKAAQIIGEWLAASDPQQQAKKGKR
ncbi:MAG: flagellar M-ring protein FliF [Bdellovibrionales bacterium]|nr:flagellar M-ring protein FliF [Bdellovibrionales bacterium]